MSLYLEFKVKCLKVSESEINLLRDIHHLPVSVRSLTYQDWLMCLMCWALITLFFLTVGNFHENLSFGRVWSEIESASVEYSIRPHLRAILLTTKEECGFFHILFFDFRRYNLLAVSCAQRLKRTVGFKHNNPHCVWKNTDGKNCTVVDIHLSVGNTRTERTFYCRILRFVNYGTSMIGGPIRSNRVRRNSCVSNEIVL